MLLADSNELVSDATVHDRSESVQLNPLYYKKGYDYM